MPREQMSISVRRERGKRLPYWEKALTRRSREAETRFQAGLPLDSDDIVVMALIHEDKFGIMIQRRTHENTCH